MKRIPLTKGKEALADDQDYEYLMQWKWYPARSGSHNKLYARRNLPRADQRHGSCKMHKIVAERMGLPDCCIDHKDGNGLNNQRSNLRPATNAQNLWNRAKQKNNTSGYKGVSWDASRGKWMAQLKCQGRKVLHRRFADKIEAAQAYNETALKYFGEFAVLNLV
jgi:hypothetical protein